MSDRTAIEWSDATWNFLAGCSKVSAGCANCYAIRSVRRIASNPTFGHRYVGLTIDQPILNWSGQVAVIEELMERPLRWTRPRRIFVNSQSDLFHEKVSEGTIARAFAVMALASQHAYQVLTKRPERMQAMLTLPSLQDSIDQAMAAISAPRGWCKDELETWPLPNVWLGASVEDQRAADERIPPLLNTPAAVRFLSCEPLLGPVDLSKTTLPSGGTCHPLLVMEGNYPRSGFVGPISWVIAGGESGPNARPMHPDWARSLRDQCRAAGVAFHFKQHGEWIPGIPVDHDDPWDALEKRGLNGRHLAAVEPNGSIAQEIDAPDGDYCHYQAGPGAWWMARVGRKAAGRELDGRTWDEFPTAREAVIV